jgi:putative serine protease PepD
MIYSSGNDFPVIPGSPAAKAGLVEEDIIIKVGDYKIQEGQSLVSVLSNFRPGDKVELTYIRDGKERAVSVTLAESK